MELRHIEQGLTELDDGMELDRMELGCMESDGAKLDCMELDGMEMDCMGMKRMESYGMELERIVLSRMVLGRVEKEHMESYGMELERIVLSRTVLGCVKVGSSDDQLRRSKPEKSSEGSVTLEAAVALPVFMCVVMMLAFLLRVVYVQEYVQHSITQTAVEIAGTSYVYAKLGLLDIQREAEGVVDRARDKAEETVMKSLEFETLLPREINSELIAFLDFVASCVKGNVNGFVFGLYSKYATSKYLGDSGGADSGEAGVKMRGLNVADGYDGVDFTASEYLLDGGEDVVIQVRYSLKPPLSIRAFSEFEMTQKACARAWLFGSDGVRAGDDAESDDDGEEKEEEDDEEDEDIWSLGNFERGRRIREIFNGNLPYNFPGISSFEGGVATLIKSLDTTAASYQNSQTLSRVINSYIDDVISYKGQTQPWGSEGITINPEEIKSRRLILVIPTNSIDATLSDTIDESVRRAADIGVYLQVEKYGKKQIDETGQTG
ncbi:MAG: hypothetical protein FWH55_05280 [Oscillospiraceae bacterium]|nr:hypothetical protein [Oscillospiraceae bacterium]